MNSWQLLYLLVIIWNRVERTLGCCRQGPRLSVWPLSTAPDPLGASHHSISTIMTARKNAAEWTKGIVGDFVLLGVTDTHAGALCVLVCHRQVGTSVQDHSLESSHQFPNNISRTDVGKSRENTGNNNLLPCSFVGHTIFFCTSMLIKLLEVPLPHKSFPFPKWNVSISADSVALMSASIAFGS